LLEQMGFAGASDRLRVAPLLELAAPADPPPLEDEAVAVAARRRLDLLAGEWNVEAARRQITLAQREGWPETAVGFSFERAPAGSRRSARIRVLAADAAAEGAVQGLTGGGPMPQAPQFAPRPRPVREVKYTLGPMIEMEIPIFDWNQAQTLRAIHEYNRRLAEYESLGQEVTRTVRQVLARQREAYEQVRLFREVIVPQVQANMELARQSYVAGQTDLTIYLAAQEDVLDTQRKALEFMRGYLVEQAALERAVGGRADAPPAPRVAAAASPLDESGTALEGVRR
jgi:outer membrane protein TolC